MTSISGAVAAAAIAKESGSETPPPPWLRISVSDSSSASDDDGGTLTEDHSPAPSSSAKPTAEDMSNLERMGSGSSVLSSATATATATAAKQQLPSSKYKGVVPQPNGRWGAQIYEKHHRVWLGTFNAENDAARAYDRAALKFRGRDATTNFGTPGDADAETAFVNGHSKVEIVDMLRKHTYDDELLHHANANANTNANLHLRRSAKPAGAETGAVWEAAAESRDLLFEKAVTPSDVGKLNRLVIPKQHAEKHFPLDMAAGDAGGGAKGVLLSVEDAAGRTWRFRYSYWNSSQSYVLTKGWSRFVKEKRLLPGDVVAFHRSRSPRRHLFISFRRRAAPAPPAPLPFPAPAQWSPQFLYGIPAKPSLMLIQDPAMSYAMAMQQVAASASASVSASSAASSPSSSSVRLFGVELQKSPGETLSLFPQESGASGKRSLSECYFWQWRQPLSSSQ